MNREEFNQLDIKGQVDYFNNELKQENNNFNAICKQIGISKNTILSRFKKEGLLPARQGQKIIRFNNQLLEIKEENLTAKNSEVKFSETENIKYENSTLINLISEKLPMKNKSKVSDPKDINLILKRIELLEQKVEILQSANLGLEKEDGKIFCSDKSFINSYDNTTTKTFKIDIEVYQELEKLFDKYKMYKRQDIVSSLLKYALDNIE